MHADGSRAAASASAIDRAWGELSRRPDAPSAPHGYTGARIDRAIQVIVAVGTTVIGTQAAIFTLNDDTANWQSAPLIVVVFASLAWMVIACLIGRHARLASGVFACAFPLVLAVWVVRFEASAATPVAEPWPYFLLAVAPVGAIVAFPLAWQLVLAIGVPSLFAVGRILHGRGDPAFWEQVLYDVSIALLLGVAYVFVAWTLRGVAAGVDAARTEAVSAYSDATGLESAERERVEVASLMHDSVLAALISSARAATDREHELAVSMARDALGRLANADDGMVIGTNEPVTVARVTHEVREATAQLGADLDVPMPHSARSEVPARAARALVLATTQAVSNAIEHADRRGLSVAIESLDPGIRIVVSDEGPGFDVDRIPADRLGIRGSIVARLAAAGAHAEIASSPDGTVVTLTYAPNRAEP